MVAGSETNFDEIRETGKAGGVKNLIFVENQEETETKGREVRFRL